MILEYTQIDYEKEFYIFGLVWFQPVLLFKVHITRDALGQVGFVRSLSITWE